MTDVRIGISGWTYPPWRGVFYPRGLRQGDELAYAASWLGSVELNGSFYSLQRPESYRRWGAATPDDFVFVVKGGRFITHMKKLAASRCRWPTSSPPVCWLSGRSWDRCSGSCRRNWVSTRSGWRTSSRCFRAPPGRAAELAQLHDERLEGRSWTTTDADRPPRHALEVRHPTFVVPALADLARRHDIALVTADTAGKWPFLGEPTADFAYARLHGESELYVSGYVKVRAPFDAIALAELLGVGPVPPVP